MTSEITFDHRHENESCSACPKSQGIKLNNLKTLNVKPYTPIPSLKTLFSLLKFLIVCALNFASNSSQTSGDKGVMGAKGERGVPGMPGRYGLKGIPGNIECIFLKLLFQYKFFRRRRESSHNCKMVCDFR